MVSIQNRFSIRPEGHFGGHSRLAWPQRANSLTPKRSRRSRKAIRVISRASLSLRVCRKTVVVARWGYSYNRPNVAHRFHAAQAVVASTYIFNRALVCDEVVEGESRTKFYPMKNNSAVSSLSWCWPGGVKSFINFVPWHYACIRGLFEWHRYYAVGRSSGFVSGSDLQKFSDREQ
ncbi:hypothetical protein QAD02_017152 [Eretmocerus hayati]|uniref:Uncharacterized protein n=1 Tax=Eretmocerus hayati TaxID=131215 RepID=A0ACC2PD67_9HYME|nr:hypothetical protein QAD02_017152 [Eretmocerus hayati]